MHHCRMPHYYWIKRTIPERLLLCNSYDSKPYSTTSVMIQSQSFVVYQNHKAWPIAQGFWTKLLTKSKPFRATCVVQLIPKQMSQMSQFILYNQKQAHWLVWQWNWIYSKVSTLKIRKNKKWTINVHLYLFFLLF